MRAEDRDPALLYEMLSSARRALEFTAGMDLDAFAADRMTRSAVESALGTMGRSAAKVSATARSAAPAVEWERIANFAEYLLRDYRKVTPVEVWAAVQETVPPVLHSVDPLIPPVPQENAPDIAEDQVPRLRPSPGQIEAFCRKWNVDELALFGSVLRDDFGPESDVDVLVTFAPDAAVSLFDMVDVREELEAIFGRRVDVVSKRGLLQGSNPFSSKAILGSARVIYAAAEHLQEQTQ